MDNEEVSFHLMKNLQVDAHGCEDCYSVSRSLLEEQGERLGANDLTIDEEKEAEKEWIVGPCYLICLTIGTGG
jgi:hypothetical protein